MLVQPFEAPFRFTNPGPPTCIQTCFQTGIPSLLAMSGTPITIGPAIKRLVQEAPVLPNEEGLIYQNVVNQWDHSHKCQAMSREAY